MIPKNHNRHKRWAPVPVIKNFTLQPKPLKNKLRLFLQPNRTLQVKILHAGTKKHFLIKLDKRKITKKKIFQAPQPFALVQTSASLKKTFLPEQES